MYALIPKIENTITLQDAKINALATNIGKLTGEDLNNALEENGYVQVPVEDTIEIQINKKNEVPEYKAHSNFFDFICNKLFGFLNK